MTEITVDTDKPERHRVPLVPFALALITAPLVTGLPAFGIISAIIQSGVEGAAMPFSFIFTVIAAATLFGAPTYLLFGGPAFFLKLRRVGPGSGMVVPALLANFISTPFILVTYLFAEGVQIGAIFGTLFMVAIGTPFAAIWGLIFEQIHNFLTKRWSAE